jgi:formiminoglutamase
MLNYKLFFDLVGKEDFPEIGEGDTLLEAVQFATDANIRWKNIDIALIGINQEEGANRLRQIFYRLQKSSFHYRVLDLGNVRLGEDRDENYLKISEIGKSLMQENILPIFIGGTHDFALGQYYAYQDLEKKIYAMVIDKQLDIREESKDFADKHLGRVLLHLPNYLFNLGLLGYQTYLNSAEALEMSKTLGFDMLSVGEMRNNFTEIEPLIRQADMMCFDIAAIRRSDALAQKNAFHFGLTGEEAAQIAWYAGLNEKLSSFGIYGYEANLDTNSQTAEVIAVMLWYFIEGFYNRKGEVPLRENFYTKYIIPFDTPHVDLVFYKSLLSERWWLEIPEPPSYALEIAQGIPNFYKRTTLVPCSPQDYQEATQGNLPDRLMKALARG